MSNLAAVIPSVKSPLEVREVETYTPGPNELLLKNEVIAFNPVEYKIAKLGAIPIEYPAILGSTLGGTIEAVGAEVKGFQVGERVVSSKRFGTKGNQYGAYQRYAVVEDDMVVKVPERLEVSVPASIMMNITCVVGLFSERLGFDRPTLDENQPQPTAKSAKVLVYGGSSSFGSLSIQYLSQAGYSVISTTSPRNRDFVATLGASVLLDHTMDPDTLVEQLITNGPYEAVVDMISTPTTIPLVARVLSHQGGGSLYAMEPAFTPETLPDGVNRVFEPWNEPLYEGKNHELRKWMLETYIPRGLEMGRIKPLPVEKVSGGLRGVDVALERMGRGVSGVRLVLDPWEE
jgi:NADPH:quinone reductase-like Zn-dependent oxidoreductase